MFIPAIEAAGFTPIRPEAKGSPLIHGQIVKHLSEADLVLCDLSSHNPNVFFELGVRTSLNKPIALVRDEHTKLPFDTSGINTLRYDSKLQGWDVADEIKKITEHITESAASCDEQNPLWRQFGLAITASEPSANESPIEAKLDLFGTQIAQLHRLVGANLALEKRKPTDEEFRHHHDDAQPQFVDGDHPSNLGQLAHSLIAAELPLEGRSRFVFGTIG